MEKIAKEGINLLMRVDVKKRTQKGIDAGLLPGITCISGAAEVALIEYLDRNKIPKTFDELENSPEVH